MTASEFVRPQLPTNFLGFLPGPPNQVAQRLITSGNIGFGTGEPSASLDVRGQALVEDLIVHGTATVGILEITGGGDLAESFPVELTPEVEPGTVLVIDDRHPGRLKVSDIAYDRRVAGVISGAGGVNPGVTLKSSGSQNGKALVTLAGCVWCKADATHAPIAPGDRLTTARLVGHAMKATEDQVSRGAILGKAMSALPDEQGLVMVLVNLQ
jgi:hypothetical protein